MQGGRRKEGVAPRLRALRERIATGYYRDPAVRLEIARRILASGDM